MHQSISKPLWSWWLKRRFKGHIRGVNKHCSCQSRPELSTDHVMSCIHLDEAWKTADRKVHNSEALTLRLLCSEDFPLLYRAWLLNWGNLATQIESLLCCHIHQKLNNELNIISQILKLRSQTYFELNHG